MTATQTPVQDPPHPPTPSAATLWVVLGVVLVADALDLIDSTITNIAAPTIVADIGGGPALVKWLGAAYALSLGTLLVLGGRLGDRFGQRRLFLLGMGGFTLASALCGLAVSPGTMVASRVLQGAFGALLIPQGMAIITRMFPRDMRAKAFAAFGPLLGISAVGGPVLAGFIIDADIAGLGWRPMFLINIVLGTVGLLIGVRVLPRDAGDRDVHIDLLGSLLLGTSVFALLLGLINGSTDGWTVGPVLGVVAAVGLFAAFAHRQTSTSEPLIDPALLKDRGFTSGLLMGLLYFAAVNGLFYVLSLFLQIGLGYDASHASLGLLPMTVGIIVAAGACMGLIGRLGRTLVLVGLLVTLAGASAMLVLVRSLGIHAGWWQLSLVILVIGMGAGACFGTIFDIALGDVAPEAAGSASGSLSAVQQISAGIGSAAVTSVYFSALRSSGQVHAMTVSLVMVLAISTLCLPVVGLLPRKAADQQH